MLKEDVQKREEKLKQLLQNLSQNLRLDNPEVFNEYLSMLKDIYCIYENSKLIDIYRHSYSLIFFVLRDIAKSKV